MAIVVAMALWLYGYWALWPCPLGSALGSWPKTKEQRLRPWPCYGYGIAMVVSVAVARRLCESEVL